MNVIYKVVFNYATGQWTAVSEIAKGKTKSSRTNSAVVEQTTRQVKYSPVRMVSASLLLGLVSFLGTNSAYAMTATEIQGALSNKTFPPNEIQRGLIAALSTNTPVSTQVGLAISTNSPLNTAITGTIAESLKDENSAISKQSLKLISDDLNKETSVLKKDVDQVLGDYITKNNDSKLLASVKQALDGEISSAKDDAIAEAKKETANQITENNKKRDQLLATELGKVYKASESNTTTQVNRAKQELSGQIATAQDNAVADAKAETERQIAENDKKRDQQLTLELGKVYKASESNTTTQVNRAKQELSGQIATAQDNAVADAKAETERQIAENDKKRDQQLTLELGKVYKASESNTTTQVNRAKQELSGQIATAQDNAVADAKAETERQIAENDKKRDQQLTLELGKVYKASESNTTTQVNRAKQELSGQIATAQDNAVADAKAETERQIAENDKKRDQQLTLELGKVYKASESNTTTQVNRAKQELSAQIATAQDNAVADAKAETERQIAENDKKRDQQLTLELGKVYKASESNTTTQVNRAKQELSKQIEDSNQKFGALVDQVGRLDNNKADKQTVSALETKVDTKADQKYVDAVVLATEQTFGEVDKHLKVNANDINNLKETKADKQTVTALETKVDTKADQKYVDAVVLATEQTFGEVDKHLKTNANDINNLKETKADKQTVSALETKVDTKADKQTVTALETKVDTKADQKYVDAVVLATEQTFGEVDKHLKTNANDINNLKETKADKQTVSALEAKVDTKADKQTVTALETKVDTKADQKYVDAVVLATEQTFGEVDKHLKANANDINNLKETKADKQTVSALEAKVDTKADKQTVSALETKVDTKADQKYVDAVVLATEQTFGEVDKHLKANTNDINNLKETKADKQTVTALETKVDTKADQKYVDAIVLATEQTFGEVDKHLKANANDINNLKETKADKQTVTALETKVDTKADKQTVSALETKVDTKADKQAVSALETKVDTKADQKYVDAVVLATEQTFGEVDKHLKANANDINNLKETKADKQTVSALETKVDTKADQKYVDAVVLATEQTFGEVDKHLKANANDINNLKETKADKQTVTALETKVDTKADQKYVDAVVLATEQTFGEVDKHLKANANDINNLKETKADKQTVSALEAKVDTKADKQAVTALETKVDTKADQKYVDAVVLATEQTFGEVDKHLKANANDINNLKETKADKQTVSALETKVDTKADKQTVTALETKVDTKADKQTITALETKVDTKADQKYVDAVVLATEQTFGEVDKHLKANANDINNLKETKADKQTVTALETKVDTKADKQTVTVLETKVDTKADQKYVDAIVLATEQTFGEVDKHLKANANDINNLKETKADKQTVTALETKVDTKADKQTVSALETKVDTKADQKYVDAVVLATEQTFGEVDKHLKANANDINNLKETKADKQTVSALETKVDTKADKQTVTALETKVDTKADQKYVDAVVLATEQTFGEVDKHLKANANDINNLKETKADKQTVSALEAKVDTKADKQTVSALETKVDTKADQKYVDAVVLATEQTFGEVDKHLKANANDINNLKETKADKQTVSALETKVDTKADKQTVTALETKVDTKADQKYVDAVVLATEQTFGEVDKHLKANTNDINNLKETKADKQTVSALEAKVDTKADKQTVSALETKVDTKADKQTVTALETKVDTKADQKYVDAVVLATEQTFGEVDKYLKANTNDIGNLKNDVTRLQESNEKLLEDASGLILDDIEKADSKISKEIINRVTSAMGDDNSKLNETTKVIVHDAIANNQTIQQHGGAIQGLEQKYRTLDQKVEKLGDNMEKGFAAQAALTGLFQPYNVGKVNTSVALGGYKSQNAIAFGAGYRPNENFAIKGGFASSTSGGNTSYNIGINYEW